MNILCPYSERVASDVVPAPGGPAAPAARGARAAQGADAGRGLQGPGVLSWAVAASGISEDGDGALSFSEPSVESRDRTVTKSWLASPDHKTTLAGPVLGCSF